MRSEQRLSLTLLSLIARLLRQLACIFLLFCVLPCVSNTLHNVVVCTYARPENHSPSGDKQWFSVDSNRYSHGLLHRNP